MRHFVDNHLNFKRLFAEAISENVRDYSDRSKIEPGYYVIRLGRDKPLLVACRIYERDPDDGDTPAGEMLGRPCDPIRIWAGIDRQPLVPPNDGHPWTVEGYYRYLCDLAPWAKENAPEEPIANPYRKVDFTKLPPIGPPPPPIGAKEMRSGQDLTDAAIDRSQALLGAVLGADEDGNLPPDHQIGANFPPEPIAAPEDRRVDELVANATKWSEQYPAIDTEEVAVAATDWIKQLNDLSDDYEEKFKAAKAPHEKELKRVRDEWKPRLEKLAICLRAINPLHRAYLRKKDARQKAEREAERRAAAEAQRLADQLAEQARAGGPGTFTNMIAAAEAAREAEKARQAAAAVPRRAQVRGNLGGRTHSLRTVWQADIVVIEKTFEHYKSRPEVKELLSRLANADARNPRLWLDPAVRYIPGCHTYSEEI
jgi:hypothetical protein